MSPQGAPKNKQTKRSISLPPASLCGNGSVGVIDNAQPSRTRKSINRLENTQKATDKALLFALPLNSLNNSQHKGRNVATNSI